MSNETNKKKILIVEDDSFVMDIYQTKLKQAGFDIIEAANGVEAIKILEKENPDLILLDILMPKMDGITMARKLKENGSKPMIIFLTNFKDAEHISAAVEVFGETDYIVKSDLHVDQIIVRVKEKLGIS